jgi:ornithine cyclodeaminase/alanine dehydrogenase-like protein (mu-crystallin family)
MKLRVLSASDLDGLVTMTEASQATKFAFAELSRGTASAPMRGHVEVSPANGKTLLMGAYVPTFGLAAKIVSYFPENRDRGQRAIHGIVIVLDEMSGIPTAICDGTSLTAFRTGAATCASIELLARPDASRGALFGTGGQAKMQLRAMLAARPLSVVRIRTSSPERGRAFIEAEAPHVSARLELATDASHAVEGADVVVAATSSAVPVFRGEDLDHGCHVTAIGSITKEMTEVDDATLRGARIVVDSVQGALSEAGELIQGIARGTTRVEDWAELGQVVLGTHSGRTSPGERTFFKSVGHAVQDVAVARLCLERARELGIGREIEL